MASINYATREISCKIVYYGPGLSGKTTNLQIIHRKIPVEAKSEMVSLATETDRTLFFDFLPLDLGSIKGFATKFQLYTVPGQVYYNATRKLVLRGVDGVVFVADSQRDKMQENIDSLKNLQENLKEYGIDLGTVPFVLQYNKRDLPGIASIVELDQNLNPYKVPTYEAQAHQGVGVFTTLKSIGKIVIDTFNAKYTARQTTRRPSSIPDVQSAPPGPRQEAPQSRPAAAPPFGAPAPRPGAPSSPPVRPTLPPIPPPAPFAQPGNFGQFPSAPTRSPVPVPPPMLPPLSGGAVPPQRLPPIPEPALNERQAAAAAAPSTPSVAPAQSFPPIAPPMQPAGSVTGQFTAFDTPSRRADTVQPITGLQADYFGMTPSPHANVAPVPGLQASIAPVPAPATPVAPVPGFQTFPTPSQASHSSSSTAPSTIQTSPASQGSLAPAPDARQKKSKIDGSIDPSDLDAEIARYERELADQKPTPPQGSIISNPNVNPNIQSHEALSSPFLTPEELARLQQQNAADSFPTRRMPLGPGQP